MSSLINKYDIRYDTIYLVEHVELHNIFHVKHDKFLHDDMFIPIFLHDVNVFGITSNNNDPMLSCIFVKDL